MPQRLPASLVIAVAALGVCAGLPEFEGSHALAAKAAPADVGPVHRLTGGPFEASGAVSAPNGKGVLFVDDGRPDVVLWLRLAADGSPAAVPVAVPLGLSVPDPEGITTDGTYVYVVGSQSRGQRRGATGLVRFRFDAAHARAEGAESVEDLASLVSAHVPALRDGGPRQKSALNIEGLAWDAKGGRLLLGLRAPLDGTRALVVPVALRDRSGPFRAGNLDVGAPLRVDLGGLGIRGFEADPAGGYWLLAGGVTDVRTSRLVRWDGRTESVKQVATFPGQLKAEGVTRTTVGGRDVTLVLCDTGQYLLMD